MSARAAQTHGRRELDVAVRDAVDAGRRGDAVAVAVRLPGRVADVVGLHHLLAGSDRPSALLELPAPAGGDGVAMLVCGHRGAATVADARAADPFALLERAAAPGGERLAHDLLARAGAAGDTVLEDLLRRAPVIGGRVAMLAHEAIGAVEDVPTGGPAGTAASPDCVVLDADDVLLVDATTGDAAALVVGRPGEDGSIDAQVLGARLARLATAASRAAVAVDAGSGRACPTAPRLGGDLLGDAVATPDAASYERGVRHVQRAVRAGSVVQAVLARRFELAGRVDPIAAYRALRAIEPAPYRFLLRAGEVALAGASPERLVAVRDGMVHARPIAGTRPRGASADEDARQARELRADPKELAEHVMLVDLARNDTGRVSVPGSVAVDRLLEVERHAHVLHLVSHVSGRLADGCSPVDALRAAFPAGTLTGAPKLRAIELLASIEGRRRGAFGGAIVACGADGRLESAITIRTAEVGPTSSVVQAGAGIVAASVPATEEAETRSKAAAALRALHAARVAPGRGEDDLDAAPAPVGRLREVV